MTSNRQTIQDIKETASEFRDEDGDGNLIDKCIDCRFPLDDDEQTICTLCAEEVRAGWVDKPQMDVLS